MGFIVSAIVLAIAGYNPIQAFAALFKGAFGRPKYVANTIIKATPILLTGVSVAFAFKTGLFNIGAPGQYLMGTVATLYIALGVPSEVVPAGLIWIMAFLGGCLAGARWGAIPVILKAFLNILILQVCLL